MKVLLLSKYSRNAASSRIRSIQYLPGLRARGIDVDLRPLFSPGYLDAIYGGSTPRATLSVLGAYLGRLGALRRAADQYDVVWIEKELLPWMPFVVERLLLPAELPLVVDYDDAIFVKYEQSPSTVMRRLLGDKIPKMVQGSSLVIAGSTHLAHELSLRGAKTVVTIPSSVCLASYPPAPTTRTDPPFRIGWIGSPSTARYLVDIAKPLERLTAERDTELVVIGAKDVPLGRTRVTYLEWSQKLEVKMLSRIDVGIMPLPETAWAAGKCGYKLIQYMAAWKPVVASPVGANRTIVAHEQNGFLASSSDEWIRALLALKRDPLLRRRLGEAGRRQVEASYAAEVNVERLAHAFRHCPGTG